MTTQIKINAKTFFAQVTKTRVRKTLGNYLAFTSAAEIERRADAENIQFWRYKDGEHWVYVIRTEWAEAHFYHGVAGLKSGKSFMMKKFIKTLNMTAYDGGSGFETYSNPFEFHEIDLGTDLGWFSDELSISETKEEWARVVNEKEVAA